MRPQVSASTIRRSANPAVDFYSLDDACRTCAWSMIAGASLPSLDRLADPNADETAAEERYAQEHERHLADFGEGLRSGSVGTYWISKAWLAGQRTCRENVGRPLIWLRRLVLAVAVYAPSRIGDRSRSECRPLGSRRDLPPRVAPAHDQAETNHQCRGQHATLSRCGIGSLPGQAAAVLQTVFPAWTTLDDSSRPCSICVTEHEERETIKGDLHQVARAEKVRRDALRGSALKMLAVQAQGPCLDRRQAPLSTRRHRRLSRPSGCVASSSQSVSRLTLAVVEWIRRWSDWTRDPIKYDRPDAIDNRRYICEHNLLVVDLANEEDTLDSGRVGAVMMHEWDAIKKLSVVSSPKRPL